MYVPDWFGQLVASHISKMYEAECFKSLAENDFDHGHFLLRRDTGRICRTSKELFRGVEAILYHTAENNGRWQREKREGKPAKLRTPRSIIGFRNGSIDSDLQKFSKHPSDFEKAGTVYPLEICEVLCLLSYNNAPKVIIGDGEYNPSLQLNVEISFRGRYRVGNQRYDLYVRYLDD